MKKTKLIIAVMYSDKSVFGSCKKDLVELFGSIEVEGGEYDFDKFTSYYSKEMGSKLVKRFLIFEKSIDKISLQNESIGENKESLTEKSIKHLSLIKNKLKKIKKITNEIEKKYAKGSNRTINLDPGYLSDTELVLASFKKGTNYKEDVGDGVYLHKVLEFEGDKIITFWHTFPDYREFKEHFLDYL